ACDTLSTVVSLHHTPPPEIYTLSLHDALPISGVRGADLPATVRPVQAQAFCAARRGGHAPQEAVAPRGGGPRQEAPGPPAGGGQDRKSTRLNSSHVKSSYAVFCLKKKKRERNE